MALPTPQRHAPGREAALAFAASTALTVVFALIGTVVPFVGRNLQVFVAAAFLYIPVYAARRRGHDIDAFGFTLTPLLRPALFAAAAMALIFPLFVAGFGLFYAEVCRHGAPRWLAQLAPPGWCPGFLGWRGLAHPHVGPQFLEDLLANVVVVAIPEELFFRGFLLKRLEEALPPRRRVLGGGLGTALVLSAALFALGHIAAVPDPRRLAVFFPALLFGWLRSATGTITAGVVVHAASNLLIDSLRWTFFR